MHSSSQPEFVWRCEGGSSFSIRFDRGEKAVVSAAGERYVLPIARSASGARYSDGAVEYWEHHGEASLKGAANGPYLRCRPE